MKSLPLIILKGMLALLAVGWLWQLIRGDLVRPFHPVNLLIVASLISAAILIWIPKARILACAFATLYALVFGFQIATLIIAFPSGATFSSNYGPLQFEGFAAHVVIWVPLLLIVACSVCAGFLRQKRP